MPAALTAGGHRAAQLVQCVRRRFEGAGTGLEQPPQIVLAAEAAGGVASAVAVTIAVTGAVARAAGLRLAAVRMAAVRMAVGIVTGVCSASGGGRRSLRAGGCSDGSGRGVLRAGRRFGRLGRLGRLGRCSVSDTDAIDVTDVTVVAGILAGFLAGFRALPGRDAPSAALLRFAARVPLRLTCRIQPTRRLAGSPMGPGRLVGTAVRSAASVCRVAPGESGAACAAPAHRVERRARIAGGARGDRPARRPRVGRSVQRARVDRSVQRARVDRCVRRARVGRSVHCARVDRSVRRARVGRVARAMRATRCEQVVPAGRGATHAGASIATRSAAMPRDP